MRGRMWWAAGIIIAVLMVAAFSTISASAQSNMPTWYTLNPGQSVEWVLHYNGGDNAATVTVGASPTNSLGFNVFTNRQWINADTATPLGKGTQWTQKDSSGNSVIQNGGDLTWQTSAAAPETYHIQLYSTSNQPVQYTLSATGAGVNSIAPFSPQMQAPQMAMAQPSMAAQPQTSAMAQTQTGTSMQPQSNAMARAQTGTTGASSPAPRTLPVTGGSEFALLFSAGAAFVAAGWLTRRRAN